LPQHKPPRKPCYKAPTKARVHVVMVLAHFRSSSGARTQTKLLILGHFPNTMCLENAAPAKSWEQVSNSECCKPTTNRYSKRLS
jgi:hypothetical protein